MDSTDTRPRLVQDRIYDYLKEGITAARFAPGQRLPTDDLARRVRASRTPVREALGRLAQDGLVERDGGWGYIVRQVTFKDILELYSVREALELQAARELVPNLTPEAVAELTAINRKAEDLFEAGQLDGFLSQNRTFYRVLVRTTGNRLLEQMLDLIHDRVRQVGAVVLRMYTPRAKELLIENRRIMAAIREGDAARLVDAVAEHIHRGRDHVIRLLTTSPEGARIPVPRADRRPNAKRGGVRTAQK